MLSSPFCGAVLLLAFCAVATEGIRCFTCNSVNSNSKCKSVRMCGGDSVCMNLVRLENGIVRITKRCQQRRTCAAASRENHRQCQPAAIGMLTGGSLPNSFNLPPSLCRSCCDTNLCNNELYLQEDSTLPKPKYQMLPKWRPLQPAIRDVAVFLLGPDAALITFTDIKGHPASFFNVRVLPSKNSRIAPVFVRNNTIRGINFDHNLPNGTIAFLARGLSAGTKYSITVRAQFKQSIYSKKIFHSFYTRPRPPSSMKLISFDTNTVSVFVGMSRPGNGDRVDTYELSYRRFGDPVSKEIRISSYNRPGLRVIPELMPATKYVISAWTSVKGSGKIRATSTRVNMTVTTAVPGIAEIVVSELHATSITWAFLVPSYVTAKSQERFIVTLRDDTNGRTIVDTTLDRSVRSYTANGLTPRTTYTLSLKASTGGRDSITAYSDPTTTLVRCYSCYEARSRDECDQWVECPPEASGCLNEIRKHAITNTLEFHPEMYRATLVCKQPNACNDNEKQNATGQCNPDRDRNVDPPDVCRCCCEGDLCNGPGSVCGHVLGWLDPFRSPELVSLPTPVYCPEQDSLENGYVFCSHDREIGSKCSYSCAEGFFVAGVEDATCQEGGRWSAELPECLQLRSCEPVDDEGMILNCSKRFEGGSSCKITCMEGYMNTGVSRIKCSRSGKWNQPVPACLQIDDCLPDPCMNGAHCHDLINDFECECMPGWLGRFCDEEVVCEVLEAPENGLLQCTDGNRYQSRCRYACAEGFEQHGAQYTRCMPDGYWSSYEPTRCVIKNCPVPTLRLVNGGVANCTGYKIDDHCDFTCPSGLAVAGGPTRITCQRDQTWTDKVPCCDLPCPPHALVDLLFLLDSSSSVGRRNWKTLIDFTLALLDSFVIGPDDMRVGVARYNRRFDKRNEILVGDYQDVDELRKKLKKIPYNGGGTLTGKALWHLHNDSIRAPGNRPNVPDVIIVITDGMATDDVTKSSEALKRRGVKIYVVGVVNKWKRMSMEQLRHISSGSDYLQIIDEGYQKLARDLTDQLTKDVCWLPCNVKYEQRELANRQRMQRAQQEDADFWTEIDRSGVQPQIQGQPNPSRGNHRAPEGNTEQRANLEEPGSESSPVRKHG